MEKYDYRKAIKEDIINYIKDNDVLNYEYRDRDELFNILMDELWGEDDITGNGPYYYDTEDKCSEYLCHNFDLAYEAAQDFCIKDDIEGLIKQYEQGSLGRFFDCLIRCNLLAECIDTALNELGVKSE